MPAPTKAQITNALSLKTEFILNTATKTIKVTDETDYLNDLSIDVSGSDTVKGVFTILDPTGTQIYSNSSFVSPDVELDSGTSDDNLSGVTIPNDSNGEPLEGTYTITYTVQVYDDSENETVEVEYEIEITFEDTSPTVKIEHTENCRESKLTSQDSTTYSSDVTIDTRTHLINSPLDADGDPVVAEISTSDKKYIVTPIYTGTYTTSLSVDITIALGNNAFVINTIEGVDEKLVECDDELCDISCCVIQLKDRVDSWKGTNDERYDSWYGRYIQVIGLMVLYDWANRCGLDTQSATYYNDILKLAKCEKGCGCGNDEEPSLIVATGGGTDGTYNVVAGTGISVVESDVGGVTTFTVALTTAIQNSINSIANKTTSSQTTDFITVTLNGSDYEIRWVGPEPDLLDMLIKMDYGVSSVTITKEKNTLYGSRFQYDGDTSSDNPTIDTILTFPNSTAFKNGAAAYKVNTFLESGVTSKVDKPYAQIVEVIRNTSNDDVLIFYPAFEVEIIKNAADEIYFRFVDKTSGAVLTHNDLISNYDIDYVYIHFSIRAE